MIPPAVQATLNAEIDAMDTCPAPGEMERICALAYSLAVRETARDFARLCSTYNPCDAEKLYDATLRTAENRIAQLERKLERNPAIPPTLARLERAAEYWNSVRTTPPAEVGWNEARDELYAAAEVHAAWKAKQRRARK